MPKHNSCNPSSATSKCIQDKIRNNFANGSTKHDLKFRGLGSYNSGVRGVRGPKNANDKPTSNRVGNVSHKHIPESVNIEVFLVDSLGNFGNIWESGASRTIDVLQEDHTLCSAA